MKSQFIHAGILCIVFATAGAVVAQAPAGADGPVSSSVVVDAQAPQNDAPAPVVTKPVPPLDVAALKLRLRETSAIGVFTKLALSNQMDDLVQQFRSHHSGNHKASVATLRQAYELLMLKVLVLLQDGDPPLARTIAESREAIWSILADPEQFKLVRLSAKPGVVS
jgi:hypothetical protein